MSDENNIHTSLEEHKDMPLEARPFLINIPLYHSNGALTKSEKWCDLK